MLGPPTSSGVPSVALMFRRYMIFTESFANSFEGADLNDRAIVPVGTADVFRLSIWSKSLAHRQTSQICTFFARFARPAPMHIMSVDQ